jgi:DNA-directed RNA polymerase subunit RPC12/RpoP
MFKHDFVPDLYRALLRDYLSLFSSYHYPLHFSRFHPKYRLTDRPPTPLATLKRCAEIAREEGLHFVYIGNVHEAPDLESTFCPNCGKLLIRRVGYIIAENHIKDGSGGRCPYCDTPIPGIFPKKKCFAALPAARFDFNHRTGNLNVEISFPRASARVTRVNTDK